MAFRQENKNQQLLILSCTEVKFVCVILLLCSRLKESLDAYADEKEWKLHDGFSSHFPGGIKLSQCAAAWAVLALQEHRISNNIHTPINY